MTKHLTVGFIGLGYMGHGMASNILAKGYALQVKGNRNRQPIDDLVAKGALEAASVAQIAASCDILHLCLSDSPQVEAMMRGPEGIIANAKPGLIVIDTSTALPLSTEALAAELALRGGFLIDAPLGGTPDHARKGELTAMLGGDEAAIAKAMPVIETWARSIIPVGPCGAGHKMKLLMNFIGMSYAALFSEAAVLGKKMGIPVESYRQVISGSRMGNGFFDLFMRYVADREEGLHQFSLKNAAKDLSYVTQMATATDTVHPMASAARLYYVNALAQGHGDAFLPTLSDDIAALSGVRFDDKRQG